MAKKGVAAALVQQEDPSFTLRFWPFFGKFKGK
jgi:hypothetical protein